MGDELTGIFDHLAPEDFTVKSTAFMETRHVESPFDVYVDDQIRFLRVAYAAAEGDLSPVVSLVGGGLERLFLPTDDETLGDYLQRLHVEAKAMGAHRVFIARITSVGTRLVGADDVMSTDLTEDTEGYRRFLEPGIVWYAEDRDAAGVWRRVGVLFDEDGRLERPTETRHQPAAIFHGILGAASDRDDHEGRGHAPRP